MNRCDCCATSSWQCLHWRISNWASYDPSALALASKTGIGSLETCPNTPLPQCNARFQAQRQGTLKLPETWRTVGERLKKVVERPSGILVSTFYFFFRIVLFNTFDLFSFNTYIFISININVQKYPKIIHRICKYFGKAWGICRPPGRFHSVEPLPRTMGAKTSTFRNLSEFVAMARLEMMQTVSW